MEVRTCVNDHGREYGREYGREHGMEHGREHGMKKHEKNIGWREATQY